MENQPEYRTDIERRYCVHKIEIRSALDGKPEKIIGYAAVYNQISENLGNFREQIAPGFFTGVEGHDVRALFNHDPNYVLGRATAGSLKLIPDAVGLAVEITPPDTQWARDLMVSVGRGDVSQMSFAFTVADGGDKWEKVNGEWLRTLNKLGSLYDVSVVTYPAYPQTTAGVRSQLDALLNAEIMQAASGGAEAKNKARARTLQILSLK